MQIRPIINSDLATRVAWMNDPRVYQSMHFELPVLLENTQHWYERNLQNAMRTDVTFCNSITGGGGQPVAFGGLTAIDRTVGKAELYIFVDPDQQGRGLGREAMRLLCRYGFEELGLHKIYLFTDRSNLAAQRLYERCGFHLEGTLRNETITRTGQIEDRLYYGLQRQELIE